MDDSEINRIIDNDREWRRHTMKKLEAIQKEQSIIQIEIAKIKVWIWIGRAAFVGAWGGIYAWIRAQLNH